MMSKLLLPVVLQIIGCVIIIAELVLPSGGILTITAAGVLVYSLFYVFSEISKEAGFIFVALDIIMVPVVVIIGIKLLVKSPVTLKKRLSGKEGVISQDVNLKKLIGKTGTVINDLRPAGKAEIDNSKFDVVSEGDYIKKGSIVTVLSISGNRIVVIEK